VNSWFYDDRERKAGFDIISRGDNGFENRKESKDELLASLLESNLLWAGFECQFIIIP
jgi:CRISPR/Cas system-associated protein Cas10 (large subunit of type III CRISPR-Cas system)